MAGGHLKFSRTPEPKIYHKHIYRKLIANKPAVLSNAACVLGFPGGAKEPACQCRRRLDPWVGKNPGEGHGNPLQII